jgi:hypothetical protein
VRVRIVLAVALTLVGVAVVVALSQRAPRLAGTSFVLEQGFPVGLPPHKALCQPGTFLADDGAAAELLVDAGARRPALTVTFADPDGTVVARGRLGPGRGGQRAVTIPFEHVVDGNHPATTACVRSSGPRPLGLAGDIASRAAGARLDGRALGAVVGFRYLRAGRESWWSLTPTVAQRFGLGKTGLFGTWTLPLLAVVLAGLWLVTVRLLVREGR